MTIGDHICHLKCPDKNNIGKWTKLANLRPAGASDCGLITCCLRPIYEKPKQSTIGASGNTEPVKLEGEPQLS